MRAARSLWAIHNAVRWPWNGPAFSHSPSHLIDPPFFCLLTARMHGTGGQRTARPSSRSIALIYGLVNAMGGRPRPLRPQRGATSFIPPLRVSHFQVMKRIGENRGDAPECGYRPFRPFGIVWLLVVGGIRLSGMILRVWQIRGGF